MRAIFLALALAACCVGARADAFPNPPGCNDFAGETSVAEAACDAAIAKETDPAAKSVLLYRRAYEIIDQHDFKTYPQAIALLSQAITLFPGNYRALHERAYVYNEYGRWAEALKDIDQRIALQPQEYDGYQERAMSRFNLGDLAGAYDDRNTVVLLKPGWVIGLIARADAATWLGRFDDALRDLDAASLITDKTEEQVQDMKSLRKDIAIMTKTSHRGAKGCTNGADVDVIEKATIVGDCTRAFLDAATLEAKAKALTSRSIGWLVNENVSNAEADNVVAVALDPNNPDLHANLGFAYERSHHSTAAIEEFNRSIALQPTYGAYAGRGEAELNLHDWDGAIADGKKSFAMKPNALAMWVIGEAVYGKSNSPDEAKAFWVGAWRLGMHDDALVQRLKAAGVPIPPPDDPPKK